MRIVLRPLLPALAAFVAAGFVSSAALAQCCLPPPPPPPPPPSPCCTPPPAPPCCGGGGGGVNTNINVNVNANAHATARASASARGGSTIIVGGGGGAYFQVDQPYPTTITGLNVGAAPVLQTIRVPYEERRRIEKRVVIQAVCIDDRNVPHPAAQVRPDRDVRGDFDGELYRCIAGARLQATIADYDGAISFDGGETLACAKGQALYHGAGGRLECRTERRERDCNERSLLRRYGAGVKILTMYREEIFTSYREEVVQAAGYAVSGAAITLDGGVGGRVF